MRPPKDGPIDKRSKIPAIYERDRAIVRTESLLWVEGVVERRLGAVAIRARRVQPQGQVLAAAPVADP